MGTGELRGIVTGGEVVEVEFGEAEGVIVGVGGAAIEGEGEGVLGALGGVAEVCTC